MENGGDDQQNDPASCDDADVAALLARLEADLEQVMQTVKKIRSTLDPKNEWHDSTPDQPALPQWVKAVVTFLPFIGVLIGFALLAYYQLF